MRVRWSAGHINLMQDAELKRQVELNLAKKQLQILSAFVPDQLIETPRFQIEDMHAFVGVLLSVEITGLVTFCEDYNKLGQGGIHRSTATLNAYAGALIETIHLYGGDVWSYQGETLLAIWRAPPDAAYSVTIHEVVECSTLIQEHLGCFETEVGISLEVKLAISCGCLKFSVIGQESFRHPLVLGQAMEDVQNALRVGSAGDTVLASSAWEHLGLAAYEVQFAENSCLKVTRILVLDAKKAKIAVQLCAKHINHRESLHTAKKFDETDGKLNEMFVQSLPAWDSTEVATRYWDKNELKAFVSEPVRDQIEAEQPIEFLTEYREVAMQLISIAPSTSNEAKLFTTLNKIYKVICNIVTKAKGVVVNMSLPDLTIVAIFGLKSTELENDNALKSAEVIQQATSKLSRVSIAVTNGLLYFGVIGHPFRREYVAIGNALKKAAMMLRENKITCDHELYRNSKLSSKFFRLESVSENIFQYDTDVDPAEQKVAIIGRRLETNLIDLIVPNNGTGKYYGVCFRGGPQIGKTTLLKHSLIKYASNDVTAFVRLCNGIQRPYFCVSAIYKQVFDQLDPLLLDGFKREIWNFNEILQETKNKQWETTRKEIVRNFVELCKNGPKQRVVVFLDDFHNIDSCSLHVIDAALRLKALRLVAAGCFEENTTWDVMWKVSLSSSIKVFDIEVMKEDAIQLICTLLGVEGMSLKLLNTVTKHCNGHPGRIKTYISKLSSSGLIQLNGTNYSNEVIFLNGVDGSVADLLHDPSFTLTSISMELLNSFTLYQQLVLKTGAVLGEIFSRSILRELLKQPNELVFAETIQALFEANIFDCASKYTSPNKFDDTVFCQCLMDDCLELPKYAYCKLLRFKDNSLRSVTYDLIHPEQRKDLHRQISVLLEAQDNSCPNCYGDGLINMSKFDDLLTCCIDPENTKPIATKSRDNLNLSKVEAIPNRKIWDASLCCCLQVLGKAYKDLIYHSDRSGLIKKKAFFTFQYGCILLLMQDLEEASTYMAEAEACVTEDKDFQRIMTAKINMALAEIHLQLGNLPEAKNHLLISLRNFNAPMISFNYNVGHMVLNRACLTTWNDTLDGLKKTSNPLITRDFGLCLVLVSTLYAAENHWILSKAAATKSLWFLEGNPHSSVHILCEAYWNALNVYDRCGDTTLHKKLESSFNHKILMYQSKNVNIEIYAIAKVLNAMLASKLTSGNLFHSIQMAYRGLDLNIGIQAYNLQMETIPILATALLMSQRIDEAVHVARRLQTIGQTHTKLGFVAYYAFCIELIVETNFYLEPLENIEHFVNLHYDVNHTDATFDKHESKLLIYLYNHGLRYAKRNFVWRSLLQLCHSKEPFYGIVEVTNLLKRTENALLELARNVEMKKRFVQTEIVKNLLKFCKQAADKWALFKPRYLLYKAYFSQIKSKQREASAWLKQARRIAGTQGNVLIKCWIELHLSYWGGGFSFDKGQVMSWKLAKDYTEPQWSQIMYSLPYN